MDAERYRIAAGSQRPVAGPYDRLPVALSATGKSVPILIGSIRTRSERRANGQAKAWLARVQQRRCRTS
jgi:hypothetical protein